MFSQSQRTLATHNDAGYLNKPEVCIRSGGLSFLSINTTFPPNNYTIITIAQIIKNVMSSAAKAELCALYIATRE